MKRILFLFVVSGLFDVASVSAEVPPEMKILPRRVSHIGVTKPEKQSYVLHFSYDGQGRIVAVRRTNRSRRDEGGFRRVGEDDTVKIAYAPDRVTVTDAAGRAVYEVAGSMSRPWRCATNAAGGYAWSFSTKNSSYCGECPSLRSCCNETPAFGRGLVALFVRKRVIVVRRSRRRTGRGSFRRAERLPIRRAAIAKRPTPESGCRLRSCAPRV